MMMGLHESPCSSLEYLPWVEKYRPQTLEQIVSHHDIIATLKRFISKGQLPHLLLHGPPGTGKTSAVHAIVRTLYQRNYRHMLLELNASDDRGINVVRETIKSFAEAQANLQCSSSLTAYLHPASSTVDVDVDMSAENPLTSEHSGFSHLKIVILDEADQMTGPAQMALRRIVEKYAASVRFFLVCNYVNKINPALQSRCTKFRFAPLHFDAMMTRTKQIAEAEGIQLSDNGLETLIRIAKGDMRKVLNALQSAVMSVEDPKKATVIDEQTILETVGLPLSSHIDSVLVLLTSQSFKDAFYGIHSMIKQCGYALTDFVSALHEKLLNYTLPTLIACTLCIRLADIEYRLCQGADETIQIAALVATFTEVREDLHSAMVRTSTK